MEESLIEETEVLDLGSTYCRCCMMIVHEGSIDNMFECLFETQNQEIMLHEVVNILAPVSLHPDDGKLFKTLFICVNIKSSSDSLVGHSQSICDPCKTKAINAYEFREMCVASNERILNLAQDLDGEFIEQESVREEDENIIAEVTEFEENNCQFCGDSFVALQDLVAHIESCHHDDNNVGEKNFVVNWHICEICGEEFNSQIELEEHIESHFEETDQGASALFTKNKPKTTQALSSKRNNECSICSKRFETPSKLKRHLYVHRDVIDASEIPRPPPKTKKYQCTFCEKRVETPSKLRRHMNVHMKDRNLYNGINQHRPHPCSECSLRFWDETKLERHRLIHSEAFANSKLNLPDDHLFTCVVCLDKIPNYENCLKHMRNHRNEIGDNTVVSCKLCPKVYPTLANLIRHSRIHPENATHQCVYCDKLMGMGDDFIEHMLRHKGFRPYVCQIESCGKGFEKIYKLRQHMETHAEKVEKKFFCDKCDKSFRNIEYLKRHLIRHSKIKNHVCKICPARFMFMADLKSHMSTHSDEKPFTCNICTSSFSKLSSLTTHYRAHAGDVSQSHQYSINFYYSNEFSFYRNVLLVKSAIRISSLKVILLVTC